MRTTTLTNAKSNAMAHMQKDLRDISQEKDILIMSNVSLEASVKKYKTFTYLLTIMVIVFSYGTYEYTKALRNNNVALYEAHNVDQLAIDIYKTSLEEMEKNSYSKEYYEQALLECVTKSAMMK